MKTEIARAMQVACLTRDELEKVHARERVRGYLIPNWNIQKVLKIRTIKEIMCIPDNPEALASHRERIENELYSNEYLKVALDNKGNMVQQDVPWQHSVDFMVLNNPKKINFAYMGKKSIGNITLQLENDDLGE